MSVKQFDRLVPDAVRALAEADFSVVAAAFSHAGFVVSLPARGIIQIVAPATSNERLSLLVSVGVHGDETGPLEMLAWLLDELARTPHALAVNLMVVVGNLAAIEQGKRFIEADMNRMFRPDRGDLAPMMEARRADEIMQAVDEFFSAPGSRKWHLDLHTAIRESLYPAFAVVPDVNAKDDRQALVAWLGSAGIDAVILNRKLAGTFSAYTALEFGAIGVTVELGQVGVLGTNDVAQFEATQVALNALLRTGSIAPAVARSPAVFRVAQEIIKHSNRFTMTFDRSTKNFSTLDAGMLIATDGDIEYRVGTVTEYVVFPNPDVRIGQRAGLMVVQDTSLDHDAVA